MVLFLLALSLVGFLIIELPPGNYLDVHIARLRNTGVRIDQAEIDRLMRRRVGLQLRRRRPARRRRPLQMKRPAQGEPAVVFPRTAVS